MDLRLSLRWTPLRRGARHHGFFKPSHSGRADGGRRRSRGLEADLLRGGERGAGRVGPEPGRTPHEQGRREAYFTDYFGTAAESASMAKSNLLYQGQWYSWQKHGRGTDARHLPGSAFVSFLENHDQVANTGFGDRLQHCVNPALWRAMT